MFPLKFDLFNGGKDGGQYACVNVSRDFGRCRNKLQKENRRILYRDFSAINMSLQETGAVVIIFDVGKSVSTPLPEDGKSFFEKSRDCISWILRRKILSMSKDLISILVTGTYEEGESLDDIDVTLCRNISIKYDFQMASWDMLHYIDKKVKPRDKISDWVGTLSIAIEKLKILEETYKVTNKTIVVFSDLAYTFTEAVGSVLAGIQKCNIEVNIIGSDCFSQDPNNKNLTDGEPSSKKQHLEEELNDIQKNELVDGYTLLYKLWHWVGDLLTVCSFNSALRHLSCYVKRKIRATPWNCIMDVGDFKISVQVFKKVDRKQQFRSKLKCRKSEDVNQGSQSEVKRDKIMYYKHEGRKNFEFKEISVEDGDVVAGYRYGTSVIPFSDEDISIMGFKPGKKCFTILGFTPVDNVPYYTLVGEGCYIVVPRDKDQCAERALSALIQAMSETGNVAIVRRVYSDDRGLSLGVLYPVVEEQGGSNYKECLIYIELAFHEDIRIVELPRLRRIKKKISDEQYNLIDSLIDEMDLMRVHSGDKDEVYEELELSKRHEVKSQFFSHCVVHKALYPSEPLPKEIPQHCLQTVIVPDLISSKSEKFDGRLRELFPWKVESQKGVTELSEGEKRSWEDEKTPENCFRKIFDVYGYPSAEEIRDVLESLVTKFNCKPEETIQALLNETRKIRRKTLEKFTDDYNYWMRRLRIFLGTEKDLEKKFWKGVLEGNLGLITVEEHVDSWAKREDGDLFIDSLKGDDNREEKRIRTEKEEEEAINMLF